MRTPLLVALSFVWLGCGPPGPPGPARHREPAALSSSARTAPPAPERDSPAAHPACALEVRELESYDALVEGRRFTLELVRDPGRAWIPAEPLAMPLHHASSIDWRDRDALDAWPTNRARVIAVAEGRIAIQHDERRGAWFATYAARVEHVCPAAE